jgi:uncharacterized delta-60 repeat protein
MKPHRLLVAGLMEGSLGKARPLIRGRACRVLAVILGICCLFLAYLAPALAADGDLDLTFKAGTIQKSRVIRGKVDYSDGSGKFLIYGFFTSTGQLRNSIARMNSTGTTDTSFYTPNFSGEVRSIYLLASGQIYIAGNFSVRVGSSNEYYYNFARLSADGTLDITFPKVFNQSGAVNEIAVQSDGQILVGGYSLSVIGGPGNTFHLLRLNSSGTLDGSYLNRADPGGYVSAVKILSSDGARVFGTLPRAGTGHVDYWLDLNSAGVVQTNIGDEIVDGPILSVGTQSLDPNNGKLVICGQFQHVLGVARSRVARFRTDMTLDPDFDIGSGANEMVSDLIVQGDDKIVLAGNFDSFNGTAVGYLVRLTPDGALDGSFTSGTGANARIVSLTPGSGGSGLLIYGFFNAYKNNNLYGIAGLDANGNLVNTYVSYVIANYQGTVYALAAQSDGKILAGGDFTGMFWYTKNPDGSSTSHLQYCGGFARLNPDGTLDTSFKGGVDGYVDSIAIQADGKIMLAGKFGAAQAYGRTSLARLNPDGSLDTAFNPLVVKGDGSVSDLHQVRLLSGGQFMAAGDFATVNGTNRTIAARLNGDGSLDALFDAQVNRTGVSNGVGYRVAAVAGNYVVGGALLLDGVSGGPQGFLTRFTNTGALDTTFGPTAPPTPVPNVNILQCYNAVFPTGPVTDMLLQPDGKIVVSGAFYQIMDGSGSPPARNNIARFSGSGFLDNTLIRNTPGYTGYIRAMALQPNGKILIGVARLNPNGSQDTTFNIGTWWQSGSVYAILRQATGKAILGGTIYVYYSPSNFTTALPRVFASPPNFNPGSLFLLLD